MIRLVLGLLAKLRLLAIVFQSAGPDQVSSFHAEMMMHGGEPPAFAGLLDLEAAPNQRLSGRSGYTSTPTAVPALPARRRPCPRKTVTD